MVRKNPGLMFPRPGIGSPLMRIGYILYVNVNLLVNVDDILYISKNLMPGTIL